MMIIKDLTINTIRETCRANTDCSNCPFYAENFGYTVFWDNHKCIFQWNLPHSWPTKISDDESDE